MIPTVLNSMITLMMAKFIMNDVPHVVGLSAKPHNPGPTIAPPPTFFTHSTSKEAYESILEAGWINPHPESGYVPVSLDGGINGVWGAYVFTFPLELLRSKKAEPVFYLGTSDMIGTVRGSGFIIMDMTAIFATEITIYEPLDISQAKTSKGVPPLTPLIRFIQPVVPELKKHGRAVLLGKYIKGYSSSTLATIDAYNQMVAKLTGVDYEIVKAKAEESVTETEWEVWWR